MGSMPCLENVSDTEIIQARLLARVIRDAKTGCWDFPVDQLTRYGRIQINGSTALAHRAAYEVFIGPIPDGMEVDHVCGNRSCINPLHLQPVTPDVNRLRYIMSMWADNPSRESSVCKRGHALIGDNLRIKPNGRRECRECARIKRRERTVRDAVEKRPDRPVASRPNYPRKRRSAAATVTPTNVFVQKDHVFHGSRIAMGGNSGAHKGSEESHGG